MTVIVTEQPAFSATFVNVAHSVPRLRNNNMATQSGNTRGGSSEQHAKAGRESHKNDAATGGGKGETRGRTPEQHAKAGRESHKNDGGQSGSNGGGGTRGGSPEQHAKAGRESHKNDR